MADDLPSDASVLVRIEMAWGERRDDGAKGWVRVTVELCRGGGGYYRTASIAFWEAR